MDFIQASAAYPGERCRISTSTTALAALALGLIPTGSTFAQTPQKAAGDQHAAAIRAQIPAIFHTTAVTGSVNELLNHLVITNVGAIYTVRKSNVLVATYSTTNNTDDPSDTSIANTAGKSVPASKKCVFMPVVALQSFTTSAVSDACRRDIAMGKARMINSGERVLLAGVDLYPDKDRVEFLLLDHHRSNGVESPRFISQFAVQFPTGFLATADAGQIYAAIKSFVARADDPIALPPFLADAPAPAFTLEDTLNGALGIVYQLDTATIVPAAVLRVKADRFLRASPQALPLVGCALTLRDGRAKDPSFLCKSMGTSTVYMKPGDDLLVRGVKVESKKDKDVVRLDLVDVTQVDPAPQANGSTGHYHGAVEIEFAKGSLGNGDVAKVKDQIAAAFNIAGMPTVAAAPNSAVADAGPSSAATNTAPLPAVVAPPQTLEEQLKTFYKLTTVGDKASVVSRGTVLTVTSDQLLLGTPYAKPAICATSVVEGKPKPPLPSCVTPLRPAIARHEATYFAKGQKLDVVSILVDMGSETVAFGLIDDPSTGGAPKFHTTVNYVFPKGYLETSDAGQVGELVNSLLQMPGQQ